MIQLKINKEFIPLIKSGEKKYEVRQTLKEKTQKILELLINSQDVLVELVDTITLKPLLKILLEKTGDICKNFQLTLCACECNYVLHDLDNDNCPFDFYGIKFDKATAEFVNKHYSQKACITVFEIKEWKEVENK